MALTANAISGAREMFLQEGFNDYLTKPIDSHKLETMIARYLPKEMLQEPKDEKSADNASARESARASVSESTFPKVDGVDIEEGLKNCGQNPEILRDTMQDFVLSAKTSPDKILSFYRGKDWRNYTILVHGLKSAARLIGATSLSELAEKLENAGNGEDVTFISDNTDRLIAKYREIAQGLETGLNIEKEDDSDKEPLPEGQIEEIYNGILEFVSVYDFTSAENMLHMLDDYRIPSEEKDKLNTLYDMIRNVDHDGVLGLLGK